MRISYNGMVILADPMLGAKGAYDPFVGVARNPTVELPKKAEDIVYGVDLCLVSHTHLDHFDAWAINNLSKNIPIICQPSDESVIKSYNFTEVTALATNITINGTHIIRTPGEHGRGAILQYMGLVSGFILKADNMPTIYWVGDSVLNNDVINTLKFYKPDYVITHSGRATFPGYESTPIIMGEEETTQVLDILPNTKVIAIHMESLDHCITTRSILRNYSIHHGYDQKRLLIPEDGEILDLTIPVSHSPSATSNRSKSSFFYTVEFQIASVLGIILVISFVIFQCIRKENGSVPMSTNLIV